MANKGFGEAKTNNVWGIRGKREIRALKLKEI